MIVLCVGVDHRTAPLAVRERLAFSVSEAEARYRDLAAAPPGAARPADELTVLSTCNRVEVYGAIPDEGAIASTTRALSQLLARAGDVVPDEIVRQGYVLVGSDAERHLCRVAAGLESIILGEAEILGQVADAFALARRARATGPTLDALGDVALRAGRRARAETSIGRNPVSVSSVAADLAEAIAPDLRGRQVLLLGAGKMARIAADLLVARGKWSIRVASRTLESARVLAERIAGAAIGLESLPGALADTDLVIACSASPTPILGQELVRAAMRERFDRPLAIFDIAVPRDADPAVRQLPGVRLYDVDELRPRVEESLASRRQQVPGVEAIVEQELQQLAARRSGAGLLKVVDAWRWSAEETRRREVQHALREIPDGNEIVRDALERLSVILVKRLLDEPSRRLRAEATNGHAEAYAQLVRRLFTLDAVEGAGYSAPASPATDTPSVARA